MHNNLGNADNWESPRPAGNPAAWLLKQRTSSTDCHPKEVIMAPWESNTYGVNLHNIVIFKHEGFGLRSYVRSARRISEDGIRDFIISIPLRARSFLLQDGKESRCEPGHFRILSMSKPFSATAAGCHAQDSFSLLVARISGAILRQEVAGIDDISNSPIQIRSGTGNIMKSLLEVGLAEGKALTPYQAQDFSKTVIHAIANAVLDAPELKAQQACVRQTSYVRILESAKLFIESNLSNPFLDNALVASHCRVSERYLQKVFTSLDLTVAAHIRERRLQQCRADLKNTALRNRTITNIAIRWGFENSAAFSRAYKARFGITPSAEEYPDAKNFPDV